MTIFSELSNLGDNLWLTPLFHAGIATKISLPNDARSRAIAPIFNGLAEEIIYRDFWAKHVPESSNRIHRAKAHLEYFGSNASCIPKLIIQDGELEAAKNILSSIQNPIAVNFTTWNAGADHCSARRIMNAEQIQSLVKELIDQGYTPVNLGLKRNTPDIPRVVNILDLNIRTTAACYASIGKYVGTESGTSNLMIACGGRALIYHPDSNDVLYPAWKYHFTEEYWTEEPCRAKYINFTEMPQIANDINFLTK